jgi:outer membrane protein assembly factor BamB
MRAPWSNGDLMLGAHVIRIRLVRAVAALLVAAATALALSAQTSPGTDWPQWGGPFRNFTSDATGLADAWPASGPPVRWTRPLGIGHSAIVSGAGRLFTLYRPGREVSRKGPWEREEVVIALDAATGKTLWEHRYASEPLNFSFGAGPHSTPLVVGNRLFTTGTNKQLFALDAATGRVIWSHDLVREYGAPPTLARPAVKAGYAVSPLAWRDTIIVQAGGPGQAVMAFRQADGALVWKSGDFLVSESAPILIDVAGQPQVVVFAGQAVHGLDPANGQVLWSHPHDTSGDMNNSTPIWGPDNVLLISSGYNQGTRALRLTRKGETTSVEELWFTNRLKIMFANALRLGDHLYATHGDFGPAIMTALSVRTGEVAWQERGFGRSSFVYADGKAIVIDEDGDLALVRLSPEGMTVLSEARIFDTVSWTAPTLVGNTLYARDREKIVALNVGAGS